MLIPILLLFSNPGFARHCKQPSGSKPNPKAIAHASKPHINRIDSIKKAAKQNVKFQDFKYSLKLIEPTKL
jgi:hypothetical protein